MFSCKLEAEGVTTSTMTNYNFRCSNCGKGLKKARFTGTIMKPVASSGRLILRLLQQISNIPFNGTAFEMEQAKCAILDKWIALKNKRGA